MSAYYFMIYIIERKLLILDIKKVERKYLAEFYFFVGNKKGGTKGIGKINQRLKGQFESLQVVSDESEGRVTPNI